MIARNPNFAGAGLSPSSPPSSSRSQAPAPSYRASDLEYARRADERRRYRRLGRLAARRCHSERSAALALIAVVLIAALATVATLALAHRPHNENGGAVEPITTNDAASEKNYGQRIR